MKIKNHIIENWKAGYTIIETMIAVSLFLVVVMMGMNSLLNANLLHQKSQDMRSIMDNLSFITEDISRNLRTGNQYYCLVGPDDLSDVNQKKSGQNCWGIAFESSLGNKDNALDQWVYYIDENGILWKSVDGPYNDSNYPYTQLTSNEVKIDQTASGFDVMGAEPPAGDMQQPFVTIRLVGTITFKNVVTPFSIQTSVSERLLDI